MSAPSEILSRTGPLRRGGRRSRGVIVALSVAGAAAGFWCYHRLSFTVPATSDGGANVLQAWDMLHGNWLLSGWRVSDVSFYSTELPEYILVELIRGLGPDVIHVSAAVTYLLVLLASGLLARGRARGGDGLVRGLIAVGIMLAPQLGAGVGVLLVNPDHLGTQVPLMLGWLVLELAPRRWYVPVLVGALLAWVQLADRAAVLTGGIPLFAASVALVCRPLTERTKFPLRSRWYELSLAAAAAASVAVSWVAARLLAAAGAFAVFPLAFPAAPAGQLPEHLSFTGRQILELYGADPVGIHGALPVFLAVVHMLGLALAVAGFGFACWRFWGSRQSRDMIDGLLTAAIAVNLVSYALSTAPGTAFDSYTGREIAAVLPLGAVLAGRRLGPWLRKVPLARPALGAVLLCYLAALGYGATQPAQPADDQYLAGWLAAHHFSYGLAGQQANIGTVCAGGRVHMAMVTSTTAGQVVPWWYQSKASWYDPHLHFADFLVTATPGGRFETVSPALAYQVFGRPAAVYRFSGYTVMVWHRNLLDRLGPLEPAPG